MTHSTARIRARLAATVVGATIVSTAALGLVAAAPAGAFGGAASNACRPFTVVKAKVHAAAVRREATLATLVAKLQARRDPWTLNASQISTLQSASAGISALDSKVQTTCYSDTAALRADATTLFTGYRVYWLRVPQTHGIEAADRLSEARTRLGAVATKLAAHVGTNAKAQADLAAMNQALTAADGVLGTPPTPAAHISALVSLAPAADMTADVAAMETARTDLQTVRASLVQARADGLAVLGDLGA